MLNLLPAIEAGLIVQSELLDKSSLCESSHQRIQENEQAVESAPPQHHQQMVQQVNQQRPTTTDSEASLTQIYSKFVYTFSHDNVSAQHTRAQLLICVMLIARCFKRWCPELLMFTLPGAISQSMNAYMSVFYAVRYKKRPMNY